MPQVRCEPASRRRRSGFRQDRTPYRATARRGGPCRHRRTGSSIAAETSFRCRRAPAGRARLCSSDFCLTVAESRKTLPAGGISAKCFRLLSAPGILIRPCNKQEAFRMLYAILCYHDEDFVGSWTTDQDAAVMKKLAVVQDKLTKQGRLGPVARLLPTTSATTLRKDDPPLVIDGPYAETKEQLLGFYIVDCNNLDEALDVARDLGAANPGGAYEIRPVGMMTPGSLKT